ncbi:PBSX family phage terminase large subunit [Clostridium beijerinckii]|uniref:Terminase n=1 Tax=Clostridium beijerinckii TaxID=1520 RepID=A0A1S9N9C0_CLOBE|nr:PBSX family phage terminase large subunit [Clostridium beijerinckii]OOP74147.1 terminase [Clostridium beijerinckii]
MANTNIEIDPEVFNEVYMPHLTDYKNRFEVYYGGGGSGKSVFITQKILYKYLADPNRLCLVVRKTGNSLKDSVFKEFKERLGEWGIYEQCKINKTDMTITLPNGSGLIFKGLDDPEKIKSISGISDIWCEEATELEEFDFDQLCIRLRNKKKKNNQVFISFNPVSKTKWVYPRWFADEPTYNPDNTMILHTTYLDNKFCDEDYLQNLDDMKKINPAYYRIYALGEFASLDKLIYTNWEEKAFDYKELLKEKDSRVAIFGTDFGYTNDYTTLICSVIDEATREIWIYDEHFEKHMTNEDIYKMYGEHGVIGERIVCDSSEPKSIEELRRMGCKRICGATKGKDSIMNGIQLIQQYKIYVHPKCTEIQEELKNYTFVKDKQTNQYINKAIDKFNHGLDAFRYSVMNYSIYKTGKIRFIDKKLLGLH